MMMEHAKQIQNKNYSEVSKILTYMSCVSFSDLYVSVIAIGGRDLKEEINPDLDKNRCSFS